MAIFKTKTENAGDESLPNYVLEFLVFFFQPCCNTEVSCAQKNVLERKLMSDGQDQIDHQGDQEKS